MTKEVNIGGVVIGGQNPVAIQSMTNRKTKDVINTCRQISLLQKAGCDIVRVAVLDREDAIAIKKIKENIPDIPLVADIHFNHKLALLAIENGVNKIRINPGNIDSTEKLEQIIDCAKAHYVPIRIGVNSGSINKEFLIKYPQKHIALIESLLSQVSFFEKRGFFDLVLSVKSTNVVDTIDINTKLSKHSDYPLHIGLTEAGPTSVGLIKNTLAIGRLLLSGIGNTIRVSLTDDPVEEVIAAKNILMACGKKSNSINFVSCPTCGRCMVDMLPIANEIYNRIKFLNANLTVAVMGCPVNGPGEAKDADIGIAFGVDEALLFKHGETVGILPVENIVENFVNIVEEMANAIG